MFSIRGALRAATLVLLLGGATMSSAQESLDDLKKRVETANALKAARDAEAAAADAEAARLLAFKKLADAQAPQDPAKTAAAEALAASKLAKDMADAKKAQADAELAAFKAKVGEMPTSGIQGSVELGEKAGSMETALLAARATSLASRQIARAVKAEAGVQTVFIFPAGEPPDLKTLREFRAARELLVPEFISAMRNVTAASNETPLAAAGIALDAATKLLGFFRSDFKVGGTEMSADQGLLAEAIAGQLRNKETGAAIPEVYVFSLYYKFDPKADAEFLNSELKPLDQKHAEALDVQRAGEARVAALTAEASAMTDEASKNKKVGLVQRAELLQRQIDRLKRVIGLYDALRERLAAEGKLETLVRQFEVSQRLAAEGTVVLTAKVHKVGGSHYVEKNLWTTFGAMPFKVMGGVIVSYSLFEGKSSRLLASQLLPVHGGFESAKTLQETLNTSSP